VDEVAWHSIHFAVSHVHGCWYKTNLMKKDKVEEVFKGELEKLDRYFHNMIRKNRVRDDIEELKKDLLQDTFLAVTVKLQSGKYEDYDIIALIWLKAEDTWNRFACKTGRIRISRKPVNEHPEPDSGIDNRVLVERNNLLATLKEKFGTQEIWDMMTLHADGLTFEEIADQFQLKTGTVKMKVYRLRNQIIQFPW